MSSRARGLEYLTENDKLYKTDLNIVNFRLTIISFGIQIRFLESFWMAYLNMIFYFNKITAKNFNLLLSICVLCLLCYISCRKCADS